MLCVRHDTVRRWLTGRTPIPYGVGDQLEQIDGYTAAAVDQLIQALGDMRDPAVLIYRTDQSMWAQRPGFEPYPASWWRMVTACATAEVPGVEIAYAEDPPADPDPMDIEDLAGLHGDLGRAGVQVQDVLDHRK